MVTRIDRLARSIGNLQDIVRAAGPVKTDEARDVVLHRQIVESGFLDFVKASGAGHPFHLAK